MKEARLAVTPELDLTKLEQLRDELRELIREAHGATKDLRQAVRDAKKAVESDIAETMKAEVERQVAHLGEATGKAMRAAVEKVHREFDRLEAIFTGTDPQSRHEGKPPLEELLRAPRPVRPQSPKGES